MHRRSLLAGVATAGVATVAGCSAITGGGGGGSAAAHPATRWALAPTGTTTPGPDYSLETLDPAGALAARDGLDAEGLPANYDSFLWQTLAAGEFERVIQIEPSDDVQPYRYRIVEGDLDVDRVRDAYADAPTDEPADLGSYEGYRCFDAGEGLFLHGVTDGRAIEVPRRYGDELGKSAIERVVDVGTGDAERLADRHDGLATVADRLDPRHQSGLGVVDPDRDPDPESGTYAGVTASGASAEVRQEETHVRALQVFEDEASLEAADTETWVEASREQEGYSALEIETEGRVLVGELTVAAGRLFVS